jgi:hypothetical protein
MEYLKCVRCGLEIRTKPARAQIEHCPRCLARHAAKSSMVLTGRPAVGWGDHPSAQSASLVPGLPGVTPDESRAKLRSAGASRRASQAALAAAVRNLRSPGPHRPAR